MRKQPSVLQETEGEGEKVTICTLGVRVWGWESVYLYSNAGSTWQWDRDLYSNPSSSGGEEEGAGGLKWNQTSTPMIFPSWTELLQPCKQQAKSRACTERQVPELNNIKKRQPKLRLSSQTKLLLSKSTSSIHSAISCAHSTTFKTVLKARVKTHSHSCFLN